MSALRLLSLPTHSVIELIGGLALMAAPFALGFGPLGFVVAFGLGAVIVGIAVGGGDGMSISAHVAVDQALVAVFLLGAIGLALLGDRAAAVVFLAAGIAQLALIASTRYTRPFGAHVH